MDLNKPAAGRITQYFGRQTNGSFHYGTDRGWGNGKQVNAMLTGQVIDASYHSDYGWVVFLDHGLDSSGRHVQTRYCHLAPNSIAVKYGAWVAAGTQIGLMGSTGSLTKQVHLHSELWLDGVRHDELAYTFIKPGTPPAPEPVIKRKKNMFLIRDTSPTYFLVTDNGMWVVPTQADAEKVDRVLNYSPSPADVQYVVALLKTPAHYSYAPAAGNAGLTADQDSILRSRASSTEVNAIKVPTKVTLEGNLS